MHSAAFKGGEVAQKREALNLNGPGFAKIEQNASFKSTAVEQNLIKPTVGLQLFNILESYFWDMPVVPPGNTPFVYTKCRSLFE